jgi:hypothetical protein
MLSAQLQDVIYDANAKPSALRALRLDRAGCADTG